MHYLFEQSDALNTPIECYIFDTTRDMFPVKPHWHYFIEIIYMLKGEAQMNSGKLSLIANPGDMVIFHPQNVHSIYSIGNSNISFAVLKFDINTLNLTSAYIPKLRSIFKSAQQADCDILFDSDFTEKHNCKDIFLSCIDEIHSQHYGFDLVIKSKLYELILNIVRHWQENGFIVDSKTFANDDLYDISSVTEYIDRHLSEKISVEQIAQKCQLSYSCFAKKFSEHYSMSCKEYIEQQRIFMVEEMLLFTDFDLTFIAQETGFSDCSHMIKSFKAKRGTTPKQFRLERKKA